MYTFKFKGRKIGAIGIFERHAMTVQANSPREALMKVYDKYEHLTDVRINDIALEFWHL